MPSITCLCGCSGARRVLYKLLNQVRPCSTTPYTCAVLSVKFYSDHKNIIDVTILYNIFFYLEKHFKNCNSVIIDDNFF